MYAASAQMSFMVCDRVLTVDSQQVSTVVEHWNHSYLEVGEDILRLLVPGKKTYIGQLESLAAAAFYSSYPSESLVHRRVIHWVDNVSAVAGLAKGYSGSADTALIINYFDLRMADLRMRVWWEWIPSGQNIADLPSRWVLSQLPFSPVVEVIPGVSSTFMDFVVPPFHTWEAPLRSFGYLPAGSTTPRSMRKRARGKRGGH